MNTKHKATDVTPRWKEVADRLEKLASGPTPEQLKLAKTLRITLPPNIPAYVAAIVIRVHLKNVLFEVNKRAEIPEQLQEFENKLNVKPTNKLLTETKDEVSAWFYSRYTLLRVRALREIQPGINDIVTSTGWKKDEKRAISSIGDDGRIFMKGYPPRKAWPDSLQIVERVGSPSHADEFKKVEANLMNSTNPSSLGAEKLKRLKEYELESSLPSDEAISKLKQLLESGEEAEAPFQTLLTDYPELLATTVMGGWKTYVVPKPRFGSEYVPDFLVLGINSIGPQWVLVEIEAAKHNIHLKNQDLSYQTRHAVKQIKDWREWLTTNIAYARNELGFHGLTDKAPGLVIIGRGEPSLERVPSRAQSDEESRIAVHSWDWLLRNAQNLQENFSYRSSFAVENTHKRIKNIHKNTPFSLS